MQCRAKLIPEIAFIRLNVFRFLSLLLIITVTFIEDTNVIKSGLQKSPRLKKKNKLKLKTSRSKKYKELLT